MSATGLVSAHNKPCNGLRPMQLRRDLAAIADLIETCFVSSLDAGGRSAIQEMRALSRSGPLLPVLSHLDSTGLLAMRGFVWEENGQVVGNASLSPAGYDNGWIIANVAVSPNYRRRGIARQLMHAALGFVVDHSGFAILQVEADNAAARALYDSLGFQVQRTFTRWRRGAYLQNPVESFPLRRVQRDEAGQFYALAEQVRPDASGGLGWQRPTRPATFQPVRLAALRQIFTGRKTDLWVLPGVTTLNAGLIVETRTGCTTALFDLLVHPAHRGTLELPLLQYVIHRLEGRFRPLLTQHPTDDDTMTEALRRTHFRPERTLVHMIWRGG